MHRFRVWGVAVALLLAVGVDSAAAQGVERVVGGRKLRARGIPNGAFPEAVGRDARGRVVLTLTKNQLRNDVIVARDWWIYDIRRDSARRIDHFRGPCDPENVAVWRKRLVYAVGCYDEAGHPQFVGLFVRQDGRTRRLASWAVGEWPTPIALRGDTLAVTRDEGDGDTSVYRVLDDGQLCAAQISGSYLSEQGLYGPWVAGSTIRWWVWGPNGGTLMEERLDGGCGTPGAPTKLDVPVRLRNATWRVMDGRTAYFPDKRGIQRFELAR